MLEAVIRIGSVSMNSVSSVKVASMFITFIWSCTNFLAPKANGLLLSFKSLKKPHC